MKLNTVIFKRVPPGDRWAEPTVEDKIYPSLTDAIEYYYQQTGIRQYHIDAGKGEISTVDHAEIKIPPRTFSIYDDTLDI